MAIVRPFPAVRPAYEFVENIIALPYDVMNRSEAKEMAKDNPYSFLHISRSEIDLDDSVSPYSTEVYQKAKENLFSFIEKGVLIQDEKPMLYIYAEEMDGRVQTGIVACTSISEYEDNIIKKHELTRSEKEQDRINHFDICNANTEPVFLTYRDDKEIRKIVDGWILKHLPVYDIRSSDGIKHILWVIDQDEVIKNLCNLFSEIPNLYIADGHHRSASAYRVGLKRRESLEGKATGNEESNYFMSVIFPDQDLKIFDYNRVVKDLNGNSEEEFLSKLKENFLLFPIKSKDITPKAKHEFSMFLNGSWYRLAPKDNIINDGNPIESLDVSILQNYLLKPILGIDDPRTDKRIDFVGGIRGLSELERRVNLDMKVAFALYPVSIDDLLTISDQGMIMPPKSTWFEPKIGSGLFIHML
jgi:uncharacterized protein (DUF1015 family)